MTLTPSIAESADLGVVISLESLQFSDHRGCLHRPIRAFPHERPALAINRGLFLRPRFSAGTWMEQNVTGIV